MTHVSRTRTSLTTLPMALIPLFGVGLSGALHVVALHALTSKADPS